MISNGVKKLILKSIILYQKAISPFLMKSCRFYPSCSSYALAAIEKYGILKGSWKSLRRVVKCAPWHPGGIDLP